MVADPEHRLRSQPDGFVSAGQLADWTAEGSPPEAVTAGYGEKRDGNAL